mgnify:CR=1 FL=1
MNRTLRVSCVALGVAAAAAVAAGGAQVLAQAPAAIEPLHFHHVHLNSVNPAAAAAYYAKPFAKSATTTTFNGQPAVKTGHIYILFNKVAAAPTNELTGPQTSVWHFGWNTPNSREYNAAFRKAGLTIAQMWARIGVEVKSDSRIRTAWAGAVMRTRLRESCFGELSRS